MQPGVSVIIAAHEAHGTIVRAVQSLLVQSWTAWEAVVVSDDRSDYRATLRAAGIDDARLRFADTGARGAGAAAARNAGLAVARLPLVAGLDADDRYEPDRLAVLAPLAEAHGAAFDNVAVVRDADGAALSTLFPAEDRLARLDAEGFLATSVPMFPVVRREVMPGWSNDVRFCDDVVLNVRVLDRVGPAPLALRPLYEYRQREGSITFASDAGERADACYRVVLDRLAADGFGIADEGLRARFAAAIDAKRRLNADYMAAFAAGRCANFQEFLVLRAQSPTARGSDTSPSASR